MAVTPFPMDSDQGPSVGFGLQNRRLIAKDGIFDCSSHFD